MSLDADFERSAIKTDQLVKNRWAAGTSVALLADDDVEEDFSYLGRADFEVADKREVYSWLAYDFANSGWEGNVASAFGAAFITSVALVAASQSPDSKLHILGPGGPAVLHTSYFQILTIVSVVLQVVVYLVLGPIADFGALKRWLLVIMSSLSALLTTLFIICDPVILGVEEAYKVAGFLYVLGSLTFGIGLIYYYAYLGPLASHHYTMKARYDEEDSTWRDMKLLKLHTADAMASWGVFWGFLAQVAILAVSIAVLFSIPIVLPPFASFFHNGTLVNASACNATSEVASIVSPASLAGEYNCSELFIPPARGEIVQYRVVNMLAGIWFFVFALPSFLWLKNRRGPELPKGASAACVGCKSVWRTMRKGRKVPQTFLFLLAYFIYSDGISTVAGAAPILFTEEVGLNPTLLGAAIAASYVTGAASTLMWMMIARRTGLPAKWVICINVLGLAAVPLWAFFAMTDIWEAFAAAALYGIFSGPTKAFSRAAFSRMTPHGLEAEFFSFYEITDKGTSWLGPLVVAAVNEATGSFRTATFAVVAFFILGFLLLLPVDFRKASRDAKHYHMDARDASNLEHSDSEIPKMRLDTDSGIPLQLGADI